MISASLVYAATAAVYALTLVGLLAWLPRIGESRRRYCYPVVAVVGIATVTTALSALGVGVLTVNGSELDVPSVADDLISYAVLWVVAGLLVDESRRTLALLAVIPAVQVVAFNVASVGGGAIGLVCLAAVVVGHVVIAYLLLGPVWKRARDVPEAQRLLHWKARNLLLFLIGMLIAFALLSVGGAFDELGIAVLAEYVGLLIRVGFAGFLFANVDAIAVDGFGDGAGDGSAAVPDAGGVPGAD
ncbi:Bacteriorhodopsin [Halomicrobium zhouii]|uniref:Bacteriorhodopsin n=1 Tax=Halomicrobium zhouii TaxID=767519 RepID=A0A1I6KCS0_9EURY|nr:bacteriorhodopsin [Halomicrobium zhouii]SFR89019.1 Bacteriorhodopsin [Halomicrobium zhouii]